MKKIKIATILNIIIVILVLFGLFSMFTGIKFMKGPDIVLESTKLGMFKFFTVDSNVFMGIMAFIFSCLEINIIKGKSISISKSLYILKYMATIGVSVTLVTVFGYLGFIVETGLVSLLLNSNLFFHLIIPVLSIITFCFFERSNKLKIKDTLYGVVPVVLYGFYYLINVLVHMEDGKVDFKYDWYWFAQGGIISIIFVFLIMLGVTYIISLIIWKINRIKK